jgi:hypothetical protein
VTSATARLPLAAPDASVERTKPAIAALVSAAATIFGAPRRGFSFVAKQTVALRCANVKGARKHSPLTVRVLRDTLHAKYGWVVAEGDAAALGQSGEV